MLCIDDIVENTPTPSFFISFKIDMVNVVNLHKVVATRSAFSTFPNA